MKRIQSITEDSTTVYSVDWTGAFRVTEGTVSSPFTVIASENLMNVNGDMEIHDFEVSFEPGQTVGSAKVVLVSDS